MPKHDLTTLAREIDSELRAIRELVRRPLEMEFAKAHLTGPQQSAMATLISSDGLSLKELSAQLGLAHSTTSGIVDRLERDGLVKRTTGHSDRRFTTIVVTDAVRKFVNETMPQISLHPLVEALRQAAPADRKVIAEGLRTLRRVLDNRVSGS
jgi:DNA-binding MarR family transcriptional regulator